ncbi:MAG: S9 family peptidase [Bacteroidales bacterium]|jgi:dipeptidyl aminopeptidase/acylaminoacyl peptidase|nr:S9 family peptidase [Bacteroidales bacterium]MCI2144843.1 S9 family peptidase [Bacteroidales bacterium]
MKKHLLLIAVMIMAASCSSQKGVSEKVIGRADIKVADGLMTPEVLHQLGKVSDPQVSPDGTKILYGVGFTSIEENRTNRELFVMNADGSGNRQITGTAKSESNARWIEEGRKIAFLYGGQIWVMDPNGKDRKKVSDVKGGIMEFTLSPDQKQLIYTSMVKKVKSGTEENPDLPECTGMVYDSLMCRHWDHFVNSIPHSFVASFDGSKVGEGKDILDGAPFELPIEPFSGIEQLCWSPDGRSIAYSCKKMQGKEYTLSTNTDIYLYDVAKGSCKNLSEGMPGYDTQPVFSPDGKKVAWLSMARGGYEADRVRLFVMDLASGERTEITSVKKLFDRNVESPAWSADSRLIYFCAVYDETKALFSVDMEGNVKRITPKDVWYDFEAPSLLGDSALVCVNTSMMRPAEIVSVSLADGSWKQLTYENKHILDQIPESRMEARYIPTTDGKKMMTWVIYPPKFDSTKVYPAIEILLGGPQGAISQDWSYRWNYKMMASQGYIVILPNRRGTTGFGQEWCEQISGDYGGQNIRDYFSAADALKAEPYVGKMAAVGASYGGYSVYYVAGHNEGRRYAAFIAHAGIFDETSEYYETDEMWFPNWDNGGAPWDGNPETKRHYNTFSPDKYVKNWNTPILISAGMEDYRIPYTQAVAAFNCAQLMGVPSKLMLFPDENHWILKPQNSIQWNREFFAWLKKYLE